MEATYISIIKSIPADFAIVDSEGTEYPVPDLVLRGFSPVLAALMDCSMKEVLDCKTVISDFPPATVGNFVKFLYKELDVSSLDMLELFSLVQILDKYEVDATTLNEVVVSRIRTDNIVKYIQAWHEFPNNNQFLLNAMLDILCIFQVHNQNVLTLKHASAEAKQITPFSGPARGRGEGLLPEVFAIILELVDAHDKYADPIIVSDVKPVFEEPMPVDTESARTMPIYGRHHMMRPIEHFNSVFEFTGSGYLGEAELLRRFDLLYLEPADMDELDGILTVDSYKYMFKKMNNTIKKEHPSKVKMCHPVMMATRAFCQ